MRLSCCVVISLYSNYVVFHENTHCRNALAIVLYCLGSVEHGNSRKLSVKWPFCLCCSSRSVFAVISLLSFHCRNSSNWNRHCCRWMRVMQCILMKSIRMHILQLNKTIGSWSDNSDEFPNGRRTIHGFIINFRTSIYSIIFHINKQMIQLCSVPPQNILKLLNIPF